MTSSTSGPAEAYALRPCPAPTYSFATPTSNLPAGFTLLDVKPLASIPLEQGVEGGRCWNCLRASEKGSKEGLKVCGRCRAVAYCSEECREAHSSTHRPMCPTLPSLIHKLSHPTHSALLPPSAHTLSTGLLLATLLSCCFHSTSPSGPEITALVAQLLGDSVADIREALRLGLEERLVSPEVIAFLELVPQPLSAAETQIANIVAGSFKKPMAKDLAKFVLARFGGNNFVIGDGWGKEVGWGVIPQISRAFNHSCAPTAVLCSTWDAPEHQAAPTARLWTGKGGSLKVGIRTIRPMAPGDELTITYLDPILSYTERQRFLLHRYGFKCICSLCTYQASLLPPPPDPSSSSANGPTAQKQTIRPVADEDQRGPSPEMYTELYSLVVGPGMKQATLDLAGDSTVKVGPGLPSRLPLSRIPKELQGCMSPEATTELTALFASALEESDWRVASAAGGHVLGVYVAVYGWRYPLVGLHLLELAKIIYNAYLTLPSPPTTASIPTRRDLLSQARVYISWATESMRCSGGLVSAGAAIGDAGPGADLEQLRKGVEEDWVFMFGKL